MGWVLFVLPTSQYQSAGWFQSLRQSTCAPHRAYVELRGSRLSDLDAVAESIADGQHDGAQVFMIYETLIEAAQPFG